MQKTHFWSLRPTPKCKSELCPCKTRMYGFLMVSSLLLAVCVAVAALACLPGILPFCSLKVCRFVRRLRWLARRLYLGLEAIYTAPLAYVYFVMLPPKPRLSYTLLYTLCFVFSRACVSTRQLFGEDYQRELFSLCANVAKANYCFSKLKAGPNVLQTMSLNF